VASEDAAQRNGDCATDKVVCNGDCNGEKGCKAECLKQYRDCVSQVQIIGKLKPQWPSTACNAR